MLQGAGKGTSPADADRHAVLHLFGKIGARGGTDWRDRIDVGRREGGDDGAVQSEGFLKLDFEGCQTCQLAFDGNLYFIASAGIGKKANDCDTPDTEGFRDVVLGHLFDVIHPRSACSQPACTVFGSHTFRSDDEVRCFRIFLCLPAGLFQNYPSN